MTVIINGTTGIDTVQDGIVTDAKLNLTANSQEIKDSLNATGSAPIYACRAWVNYNSSSQTIRSSGNISSVTYVATGRYTLNFTTAMPDTNYTNVYGGCQDLTSAGVGYHVGTFTQSAAIQTKSTTQLQVCMKSQSGLAADNADVSVAIFR
jgi:hypothetical protein